MTDEKPSTLTISCATERPKVSVGFVFCSTPKNFGAYTPEITEQGWYTSVCVESGWKKLRADDGTDVTARGQGRSLKDAELNALANLWIILKTMLPRADAEQREIHEHALKSLTETLQPMPTPSTPDA